MPDTPDLESLAGARVALTGRFASMTQRDFAAMLDGLGGESVSMPGRHTRWLVVGSAGPPLGTDGHPTQALQRARQLLADGYQISIVPEDTFLEQLGLLEQHGEIRQRYTLSQLSRILGVSPVQIRSWVRCGLIEPMETIHRLSFFDFNQVSSAKVLCDLITSGLPASKIRDSLQRVERWLPAMTSPLGQLSVLEKNGRLLVRLENGCLAEPSGQLQLDFEAATDDCALMIEAALKTSDQWFQEALECENHGDYRGAATAYQQAIELDDGDPILHFNLGNVLYAAQQLKAAEQAFCRAVELDSDYVEAWNNLGTVLADRDRTTESIDAFRQALRVFPLYADAHFNLGDVFSKLGRLDEAQLHWQRYLQLDPKSPWAADIRSRLREVQTDTC